MRAKKDKASPNKLESRKVDENTNNLRLDQVPGVTHSSLHPRSMTLNNNLSNNTGAGRIRIEESADPSPLIQSTNTLQGQSLSSVNRRHSRITPNEAIEE